MGQIIFHIEERHKFIFRHILSDQIDKHEIGGTRSMLRADNSLQYFTS
jgi:hypothetical protein